MQTWGRAFYLVFIYLRRVTLKCSTRHSLFVFSYLCSPRSLLCSPRSLFCSTKNLNFQEVYYVLLEVYCVLLEVYCVLLKVYCVLLEVYYVLLEAYCVLLRSLLCSTQNFSLTQENTFRHPKSASLLVFYSGEHFTTIQNLQVYLCSTQENTLRQSKISKFDCVPLRRTIYNYQKLTSPNLT